MRRTEQLLHSNPGSNSTILIGEFFKIFLKFFSTDTAPNTIAREISSTAFLNLHSNRRTIPRQQIFQLVK